MSEEHVKQPGGVTEERLDRLVDGELSREEYRELLESLAREPDGWRRCALAFLEAQAWQREFPAVRAEGFVGAATESREIPPPAQSTRSGSGWSGWSVWTGRFALAASWFLVFALGAGTYQIVFTTSDRGAMSPLAGTRSGEWPGATPLDTGKLAAADAFEGTAEPAEPTGLELQIADPHGNILDQFVMPVERAGLAGSSYPTTTEPAIPDELADAAEALKYDMRANRTFVPVAVQNVGNVVVPIDRIDLQPRPARMPY